MRIAIEATLAQGQPTGMGQYVISLLRCYAAMNTGHEFLLFHAGRHWAGPDFGANFRPVSYWCGKHFSAIAWRLDQVLRREGADVFHVTGTTGAPPRKSVPMVATVHDLYPLLFPEHCSRVNVFFFRRLFKWTLRNADRFVCDTRFTADVLVETFPSVREEQVTVAHLAPSEQTMIEAEDVADSESRAAPEFLCVGAIEPRKNQLFLLDSYRLAAERDPALPPLMFIGPDRGDGRELARRIGSYGLRDRVRWNKWATPEALRGHYRNAVLLLFPTLYEGFGLPLLEAMRYQLPVVCGDIPVLREIGGDYPLYLSPRNPDAWAATLPEWQKISPGCPAASQLAGFSWGKCAELTLQACEEAHSICLRRALPATQI